MRLAIELVIILILLGLNALLSASEMAIVSVRKSRLQALADEGNANARRILAVRESPARFLAAVQIGITLAGFFAAAVGAVSLVGLVGDAMDGIGINLITDNSQFFSLVLITALLSFVSIIIGELTPKTLAIEHAEAIALKAIRPITVLSRITAPLIHILTASSNVLVKALGGQGKSYLPSVTKPEILAMLEAAEDEGTVEEEEASLVEDALNFGEIQVRSVMVPRVDVRSIENTTTIRAAVDVFFETGYSRLPVFRESPDNVLGILLIKDVFRVTWSDSEVMSRPVTDIIRPSYFVPETKQIDELLEELRARRTHIAVVLDEYGGMAGIVTLEDLLEELVGDISDEFDPGYEPVRELEPDKYAVDGRLSIHDLLDVLDVDNNELQATDAESVGGLVADKLGRIPQAGDRVEHPPLILEVQEMDGYRVAQVRVTHVRYSAVEESPETPDSPGEEIPGE